MGTTSQPFRPPQWTQPPLFTLTVTPSSGPATVYVFDSVPRVEHEGRAIVTQNPVQTGAPVSDHAYVIPSVLTVELLVSDSMQSYTAGQFADAGSRSVSAYQTLKSLYRARTMIALATRIDQYDQMMITNVWAEEDSKTRHSLRARVTFTEIVLASIEQTSSGLVDDSKYPQTTVQTEGGQAQTGPVPQSIENQNSMAPQLQSGVLQPGTLQPGQLTPQQLELGSSVPGSGDWSSSNINNVSGVLTGK